MLFTKKIYIEDWSKIAWIFCFAMTGIHFILKYTKIENNYFKLQ